MAETVYPRRPAAEILRDVHACGAELEADFFSNEISCLGNIPTTLALEVAARKRDILAIFEEFGSGHNLVSRAAVEVAEQVVLAARLRLHRGR